MITIHERVSAMVSAWRSRLVRRSSPFDDLCNPPGLDLAPWREL